VTVEIKFEDGGSLRERWDGADRWVRYSYTRPSRIASVEVDPDHTILLLKDRFAASWTRAAQAKPVNKLSNLLTFATQWLAQALASWLV
jgi:hypothetical protein